MIPIKALFWSKSLFEHRPQGSNCSFFGTESCLLAARLKGRSRNPFPVLANIFEKIFIVFLNTVIYIRNKFISFKLENWWIRTGGVHFFLYQSLRILSRQKGCDSTTTLVKSVSKLWFLIFLFVLSGGSKGNFIMFASATSGDRENNNKFSG